MRQLTYSEAINEGLKQAMEISSDVIVMGQLVDYKPGVFGLTSGLVDDFGEERVRDFPVAEGIMTSCALGASLTGMRPVIVHQRLYFMFYSFDAIMNWMALWYFKSNGKSTLPVTILAVVGKGWGQAAQHSKSMHASFAHVPGLRVVMPSTAYDAKGLILESVLGSNPTIMIINRALLSQKNNVPDDPYKISFGKAKIRRKGSDVSIVAAGSTVSLALRASETLAAEGVEAEVIDVRTLSPLDRDMIRESVSRTGRLAVVDAGWQSFGFAAEVISDVCESNGSVMKANPVRICLPDSHTPMSYVLEEAYYINENDVLNNVRGMFR